MDLDPGVYPTAAMLMRRACARTLSPRSFLLLEHSARVSPEDRRRAVAQRAAEIAERRAIFNDNNNNN